MLEGEKIIKHRRESCCEDFSAPNHLLNGRVWIEYSHIIFTSCLLIRFTCFSSFCLVKMILISDSTLFLRAFQFGFLFSNGILPACWSVKEMYPILYLIQITKTRCQTFQLRLSPARKLSLQGSSHLLSNHTSHQVDINLPLPRPISSPPTSESPESSHLSTNPQPPTQAP